MARARLDRPTFKLVQRGSRYYVRWWERGGWRRVSTGTADQREAARFLAQFEAGYGTPEPPQAPTVSAILDGYMADRRGEIRGYASLENCAKALRRHLGDLQPDHLTKERCRFYVARRRADGHMVGPADARRKKPIQDGTIIREMVVLRTALKWAVQAKWIADRPHIEVPSQPPPRARWLTREEADRLLAAAVMPHIRTFLALALHTAARANALLELTWDRVDLEAGRIDLGRAAGGKGRAVVPINAPLMGVLREARAGAACPYVVEHGSRPVASVKTGTRAAARRAGLPGVTPHVLRHTAATWMVQAGVPIAEVSRFLGHANSRITERVYAKHAPHYLARAAKALEAR